MTFSLCSCCGRHLYGVSPETPIGDRICFSCYTDGEMPDDGKDDATNTRQYTPLEGEAA